ncbi:MAG: hypothetical protein KGL63_01770 [Betaproteobacteria bacterium]|nr:hypothetical protein [Betaproteobacteria bacterium]
MLALLSGIISTRLGRYLLASIVLSALAFGAWWHFSAIYEARGYAKRQAEDAAAIAKLQRGLDASAVAMTRQADQIAQAQINNATLLGQFQNAIPSNACAPSPSQLRDLRALWGKAARSAP